MVEMSLAEYREQLAIQRETGAELERERIIKLLAEWPICKEGCYCLPCELGETDALRKEFAELIALIKGEN